MRLRKNRERTDDGGGLCVDIGKRCYSRPVAPRATTSAGCLHVIEISPGNQLRAATAPEGLKMSRSNELLDYGELMAKKAL